MLKLVTKLKTNKLMLLVNMKSNSSIIMGFQMAGMTQNKQKWVSSPKIVEKQIYLN